MNKVNYIWDLYDKIEVIDSGSYSDVYKAKNKLTQKYVAIKEIKKIKINYSEKVILKETEIMKKLESESLILLIEKL